MTLYPLDLEWIEDPAYRQPVVSVDLCHGWERIGQLQKDAFAFVGVERDCEPGDFTVTFPDGAGAFGSRQVDGEWVAWTPWDVDSIRLVENGRIRFAGQVVEPDDGGQGGVTRIKDRDGSRWEIRGKDLFGSVLSSRIAFPDPSTGTATWAVATDDHTDVASSVIAAYINDNLGQTALSERAIDGLSVVDPADGETITWTARLLPLSELVQRLCQATGYKVRLAIDHNANITVRVQTARDLTSSHVLFDQAGHLTSLIVRQVPKRATWVLAGGDGQGTSRTFDVASSGEVGADRRELFVDVASSTEAAQVATEAQTALRRADPGWVVSAETIDDPNVSWSFGRDVTPGDTIAIDAAGRRFPVPVTAVTWQMDAGGLVVRATLGDAIPNALLALIRRQERLEARNAANVS